jgi:hypothetical protein
VATILIPILVRREYPNEIEAGRRITMAKKNWDWAMLFCCLNGGVRVVPEFLNNFVQIPHSILHILGLLKRFLNYYYFFKAQQQNMTQ